MKESVSMGQIDTAKGKSIQFLFPKYYTEFLEK